MINAKTLARLAAVTLVLGIASGLIGEGRDFLWIADDLIWISFLVCALALIVLTVAVLARSVRRGSRTAS